jgi:RNA methyltransferase, TrmH family
VITSAANPRLRLVRRLQASAQRRRLGLFVAEGEDLVDAALAAGLEPVDVLVAGENVEAELLAGVSELPHPARTIGVFRAADLPPFAAGPLTLALWHVGDPGNVGTLLRSADAFGAAVCVSGGCGDVTGPKAMRASAGAIFRVPVGQFEEAPEPRIALVAHGGRPLPEVDLGSSVTFVLGAERMGLPVDVVDRCDAAAMIPLAEGAESLNVAVAGSIALYEWSLRRQRLD